MSDFIVELMDKLEEWAEKEGDQEMLDSIQWMKDRAEQLGVNYYSFAAYVFNSEQRKEKRYPEKYN